MTLTHILTHSITNNIKSWIETNKNKKWQHLKTASQTVRYSGKHRNVKIMNTSNPQQTTPVVEKTRKQQIILIKQWMYNCGKDNAYSHGAAVTQPLLFY